MLAEIAAGQLDPRRLVTKVIGLDEAPAALTAMSRGSAPGTTVIELGGRPVRQQGEA
jgi:alcohol dehydrogenase